MIRRVRQVLAQKVAFGGLAVEVEPLLRLAITPIEATGVALASASVSAADVAVVTAGITARRLMAAGFIAQRLVAGDITRLAIAAAPVAQSGWSDRLCAERLWALAAAPSASPSAPAAIFACLFLEPREDREIVVGFLREDIRSGERWAFHGRDF